MRRSKRDHTGKKHETPNNEQEPKEHLTAITPRTPNQALYLDAIYENRIVFGHGPAGTGKTFLAVWAAINLVRKGYAEKIVISRPLVEGGNEKMGFLPGDVFQKTEPFLKPLLMAAKELFTQEEYARVHKDLIEIIPLAHMRGLTFKRAVTIIDEAQNSDIDQIKLILTRIGEGTRIVVNGDTSQSDLKDHRRQKIDNGLDYCVVKSKLMPVKGVADIEFTEDDIVRDPIIKEILRWFK